MTRTSRTPSMETREKLRQAAIHAHAQKTEAEKKATAEKISHKLRDYWATIPKEPDEGHTNW